MKKIVVLGACVALLAMLAAPLAVFAGSTGTVPVTGTIGNSATISITVPTVPGFGTFQPGTNSMVSNYDGEVDVTGVNSNGVYDWQVTAMDQNQVSDPTYIAGTGHMVKDGDPSEGIWLIDPLYISSDNWVTSSATADAGITYTGSGTEVGCLPFYAHQTIESGDNKAGDYLVTIEFSASLAP